MSNSHFIGEVTLRTPKRVFLESDRYRVESEDRRGNKHGSYVPIGAVQAAMEEWGGERLTAEEATSRASSVAEDWKLPYTYGHKLRYAVQNVLVVLAAENCAVIEPEGRGFAYTIKSGTLSQLPTPEDSSESALATPIEDLAAAGENHQTEFKSSLVYDFKQQTGSKERVMDVVRTIAGFLNTEGGTLLVGVKDDGEICGLRADYEAGGSTGDADRWVLYLRTQIQNAIGHAHWASISCTVERIGDQDVARIVVSPAKEPAFVKWRGDQAYFIRTLNATQKLDMEAAIAYIRTRFG